MNLGVVSLAFRCVLVGGEARTSEESKAVSWRTLEEVKRDVPEARAVRVFDALHASGVPARIHDGSELIERMSPGTVLQTVPCYVLTSADTFYASSWARIWHSPPNDLRVTSVSGRSDAAMPVMALAALPLSCSVRSVLTLSAANEY
jgi:hypothetical protein